VQCRWASAIVREAHEGTAWPRLSPTSTSVSHRLDDRPDRSVGPASGCDQRFDGVKHALRGPAHRYPRRALRRSFGARGRRLVTPVVSLGPAGRAEHPPGVRAPNARARLKQGISCSLAVADEELRLLQVHPARCSSPARPDPLRARTTGTSTRRIRTSLVRRHSQRKTVAASAASPRAATTRQAPVMTSTPLSVRSKRPVGG
jgi:hypothetical protein